MKVLNLSDALKNDNCKLTKLDIRGNELTDKGTEYLNCVQRNVNRELILHYN